MIKKAYITVGLLFVLTLFTPEFTKGAAIIEMPYGGRRLITTLCNCKHGSPSQFAVTIFDYVQNRPIILSYMAVGSRLYSYFNIWTATYLLGSYNPAVRGTCMVSVSGGDCEPLPDDGLMGVLPGTGTSMY